jgi:predicted nucleic acid-binding protein
MGKIIPITQIHDGTSIFIDANIFIYHAIYETPESHLCTTLLKRIENGEITGFTSTIVLSEISHRLMFFEAIEKYEINPRNAVRFLKENPDKLRTLNRHIIAVNEIREMGISFIPAEPQDIFTSQSIQAKYGFLTNDSINIQLMLKHSILNIASNDSDFERVDFITLYKPIA